MKLTEFTILKTRFGDLHRSCAMPLTSLGYTFSIQIESLAQGIGATLDDNAKDRTNSRSIANAQTLLDTIDKDGKLVLSAAEFTILKTRNCRNLNSVLW